MDHRKHNSTDAWDDGVYGTGNTSPPKSYSGIIALLLILVIFLSGIISLLSFMNIKLFQQLSEQSKQLESKSPMAFKDLEVVSATLPTLPPEGTEEYHIQQDVSLNINRSPQSVENVPEVGALSWQEIYEKNNPSVVCISTTTELDSREGSGIVVSDQGYIITTYYMAANAETITVTLYDGTSCSAVVVGADAMTDLALLYVRAEHLIGAEFGDSDALRVGDSVAAMGGQMSGSLSDGIISAINRDVPFLGQNVSLIQSSIPLDSGSTGGPLINCYGQIVGIHTGHLGGSQSTFAIPSTTVKQIVDQLIAQGYVSGRPTLGLSGESITKFDRYYFQLPEGLYLSGVSADSDAHDKGIAPGDILLRLDGKIITTQAQLDAIVNSHAIGDTVAAVFYREGKEKTIALTVTEYTG